MEIPSLRRDSHYQKIEAMCELFGLTAERDIYVNDYLKEFATHSEEHPHGWGLAVFRNGSVTLEKEPVKASKSDYLKHRLSRPIEAKNIFAHIRLATIGSFEYANCHPFVWDDVSGRTWTLMHNGTLFDTKYIDKYFNLQEGTTDSEGVLLYIVDEINRRGGAENLTPEERFEILDDIVVRLSKRNKLNMMLYDGEIMYVHTNNKGTLNELRGDGFRIFATSPLDRRHWEPVKMNVLKAYRDGEEMFTGTDHGNEYVDNIEDLKLILATFSGL